MSGPLATGGAGGGLKLDASNDPVTAGLEINAATTAEPVLILQTTDDNAANPTLEVQSAAGADLAHVEADGTIDTAVHYEIGGTRMLTYVAARFSTFVGASGNKTLTGSNNYGMGTSCITSLTSGFQNVGIGTYALQQLTSGANVVGIGHAAGIYNTTSKESCFIGTYSGYAFGAGAGNDFNVCIGEYAGYNLGNNATYNVYIGNRAGYGNPGEDLNVMLGYRAGESFAASNTLVIANSNTATPLILGKFDGAGGIGVTIHSPVTTAIVLTVKAIASQSANLQEWQNSAGTPLMEVEASGEFDFQWAMGNSTKDPTADAPADWVEIKIGGSTYYLPAYAA